MLSCYSGARWLETPDCAVPNEKSRQVSQAAFRVLFTPSSLAAWSCFLSLGVMIAAIQTDEGQSRRATERTNGPEPLRHWRGFG